MLCDWQKHGRRELPENPWLAQFSRRRLTERMAGVFEELVSAKKSPSR